VGDLRVLQQRCDAIVGALNPPALWDLSEFVDYISKDVRGRPIHLFTLELPRAITSFWFTQGRTDHIVVERGAYSDRQRDQWVLHEIGHMLLGHPSVSPGILSDPDAVIPYGGVQEQEAELMAGTLLARTGRSPLPGSHIDDDLARVMETFDPSWEAVPHVRSPVRGRSLPRRGLRRRRSSP